MNAPAHIRACEYIDETPGLTRRVLTDEYDRPFRLQLDYHSRRDSHAGLGDIYQARITAKEPGGGGVFADLGVGPPGLLRSRSAPSEGALAAVKIAAEAHAEKGPVLSLASPSADCARPEGVGIIAAAASDPFLAGVERRSDCDEAAIPDIADAALDAALSPEWTLSEGGAISIETTRALTTVDVDAGGRISRGDRGALALKANLSAVETAARALSLKSIGGLVVLDLLKMGNEADKRRVETTFAATLKKYFGRKCDVGRITRFGLLEASIQRGFAPIMDVIKSISPIETAALACLRTLLRAGRDDRGGRFEASVSSEVYNWLSSTRFDWRTDLENRIGPRFNISKTDSLATGDETVRLL